MRRSSLITLPILFIAASWSASGDIMPRDQRPDPLPPAMRHVILWGGNRVNVEAAQAVHANVMNVYPAPKGVGEWSGSLKPLAAMQKAMEAEWKADVEKANRAGIAVWTSFTTISFEPEVFKEYGLNPEDYYARDKDGKPPLHLGGIFGKSVYSSCYNNPLWMKLQADTLLFFDENGFGGVFYDVGGYADNAVLYCQCDYCKELWKKQLVEWKLDPALPLPTVDNGGDMTQPSNRKHFQWRMKCWEDAWLPIRSAIKAINPRFALGTNMSARVDDNRPDGLFVNGMMKVYDYVHFEEWNHGAAPFSIACSYLMGQAAGGGKPVVVVWNMAPFDSPAQEKIALAEAVATGSTCQNSRTPDIKRAYSDFIGRHQQDLVGPVSMANVGVVVSLWSRAFHEIPKEEHAAWWFGQMLLDTHVPFDYILAERDLTPEVLGRYKTLILPDVACLSDGQAANIAAFIQAGGGVFATKDTGKYTEDFVARDSSALVALGGPKESGSFRVEPGKGRLCYDAGLPEKNYWEANPRNLGKEVAQVKFPTPPPAEVMEGLDWVLRDSVPVKLTAKSSTIIRPTQTADRVLLHLVNYNTYPDGKTLTPDTKLGINVKIPAGKTVEEVTVSTPEDEAIRPIEGWKVKDGELSLELEELDEYALVTVSLK